MHDILVRGLPAPQVKVYGAMREREEAQGSVIVPWNGGGKKQRSTTESIAVSVFTLPPGLQPQGMLVTGFAPLSFCCKSVACRLAHCASRCHAYPGGHVEDNSAVCCEKLSPVNPAAKIHMAKVWAYAGSNRGDLLRRQECYPLHHTPVLQLHGIYYIYSVFF